MSVSFAIVGRPNVGKSTLFNRLIGRQHAIVDDQPGVTRDRREGDAYLASTQFKLIDTAGLEQAKSGTLESRMREQTEMAITEADVTLLVVDGRSGILPDDIYFAREIRRSGVPVILLANKCEGKQGTETLAEAWQLGLGEAVPVSAAHGDGLSDIFDSLLAVGRELGLEASLFGEDIPQLEDDIPAEEPDGEEPDSQRSTPAEGPERAGTETRSTCLQLQAR